MAVPVFVFSEWASNNRFSQAPNPKPQTPNPKPQTPNPKPKTPNPRPNTLTPKRDNRQTFVFEGAGGGCDGGYRLRAPPFLESLLASSTRAILLHGCVHQSPNRARTETTTGERTL